MPNVFEATSEQLHRRFKAAQSRRMMMEDLMQEASEYVIPQRETFQRANQGEKKGTEVYDSTAVHGAQRFASRLQTTLVPPWREFVRLVPGSTIPENLKEEVERALKEMTTVFFDHLNHSNFIVRSHEAFQDLSVSTGAILLLEGDEENPFNFVTVPLHELVPEEGPFGTIETVWRSMELSARNIPGTWPDGKFQGTPLGNMVNEAPDKMVQLVEGTVFDEKSKTYRYVVLWRNDIIVERSYEVSPWIVFRWSVSPGEVLGRGPGIHALADIRTVNKTKELLFANAAMAISGMYTSSDGEGFNPFSIDVNTMTVIPVTSNSSANPSLRALERTGDFNVAQLVLNDLQDTIRQGFFVDRLGPPEGPVRSATEIAIRNQELLSDIGSSFGRMQTELIAKLMKRGTHILQRQGRLPQFTVEGGDVTLKHESPLARAQDQEEIITLSQYLELAGLLGPEILAAGTKVEELPRFIGQKLGIDPSLLRTTAEREQLTQQVAAQVAQQQDAGAPPGVDQPVVPDAEAA